MLSLLIGCAVAGATYAYAKKQQTATAPAAGVAAVTGVGSAAVASVTLAFWPLILLGGVGYLWLKGSGPKALGPGRER
jgi:hypothetical protein